MFYFVEHSVCNEPYDENIKVIYYDEPDINDPFLDPNDAGKIAALKHPDIIEQNIEKREWDKENEDEEDPLISELRVDNFWTSKFDCNAFFYGFGYFHDYHTITQPNIVKD